MTFPNPKSISPRIAYRFRMIIAAALISILPVLLVGWTTYTVARSSLVDEVESFNRMIMKQVQERTDYMLEIVNRTVSQHIWDDQLQIVLKEGQLEGNEYELNQVITTIISMETLIDFAEEAYLYVAGSDALITANGIAAEPKRLLGDSLLEALKSNKEPFFWHDRIERDGTNERKEIQGLSYARRIPASFENPLGYFIVQISNQALAEMFRHMEFGQTGGLLAVSPAGNIFADEQISPFIQANIQSEKVEGLLLTEQLDIAGHSTFITLNNRRMLVHSMQSSQSGWKYVSIVPYQELIGHIQIVKWIVIVVCFALAGIALIAALMLTTNIHGRIRSLIDKIQSEKQALEIQVKEVLPERRAYLVRKWLTEPLDPEDKIRLERLSIPMGGHLYTAVSLEWYDYREYDEQEAYRLFHQIVQLAQQSTSPCEGGHFVRFGPDMIIAVLIQSDGAEQQRRKEIVDWGEQLLALVRSKLDQRLIIGVGTSMKHAEHLRQSYEQAVRALHHRLVEENRYLFLYESVVQSPVSFSYPFEQEREMVSLLKLGEGERAVESLYAFNDKLMSAELLARGQVIQAYSMLLAAFMRVAFEAGAVSSAALFSYNLYARLNSCKTVGNIVQWLSRDIIYVIVEYANSIRGSRVHMSNQTVIGMMDYVRNHYDEDLSLTLLSGVMEVSEAQLSQLFKKEAGIAFTDYVITMRMEKARELLRSTDMKIAHIAERMTYNNSQNFIRVFKRIVGVTPGEYRKQNESPLSVES